MVCVKRRGSLQKMDVKPNSKNGQLDLDGGGGSENRKALPESLGMPA